DLDLGRLPVEQIVELSLVVFSDRLVGVEVAAAPVDASVPALYAVAGDGQRAVVERFLLVLLVGWLEGAHALYALAAWAPGAMVDEIATLDALSLALLYGHRSGGPPRRDVEGVGGRRPDLGLPETAEEDAEHGVGVGRRADRRADICAH